MCSTSASGLEHHLQQRRIRGVFASVAAERFNERCLKKREHASPNPPEPSAEEQLQIGGLALFHPDELGEAP